MVKRCSIRPNRSNTNKYKEKQRYKELADMISEWSELYYNKKGVLKIDAKLVLCKYKKIKRLLIRDFYNDDDLKEYIKLLPNLWRVNPWPMNIIFFACMLGLILVNELILDIHTGVVISGKTAGEKLDVIYAFLAIIAAIVWIYFARKIDKKDIMEKNMSNIYIIAFRKS